MLQREGTRLRVLMLIGGLNGGGAERQLGYLANGLTAAGDTVTVATLSRRPQNAAALNCATVALRGNGRGWWKALFALRELIRQHDVLYSFMDIANVAGAIAGLQLAKPQIWGLRSSGVVPGWIGHVGFSLARYLSARAQLAIANSQATLAFYQQARFKPRQWLVVRNAVDVNLFEDARARLAQANADDEQKYCVGMIARADPIKRYDVFFSVVKRLRAQMSGLRWRVAGLGTDAANGLVLRLVADHDLAGCGEVLGVVGNVAETLSTLDVVVCCSDFEGSSNAMLEAMACGVPVVSFAVGDAEQLLRECGLVVTPATAQALADGVAQVLCDPRRRQEMARLGREKVLAEYGVDRMVSASRGALTRCCAPAGGGSR